MIKIEIYIHDFDSYTDIKAYTFKNHASEHEKFFNNKVHTYLRELESFYKSKGDLNEWRK